MGYPVMCSYRNPSLPPLITDEKEWIQNAKQIGKFDLDILPNENNFKIYTYWRGFRPSDLENFSSHPVLDILKKIYVNLNPEEFLKKPHFVGFFDDDDKSDKKVIHDNNDDDDNNSKPKRNYPKGTKFTAYLQLEIILKPYDFQKGNLFFRCTNYGFPQNIPESLSSERRELYELLRRLDVLLKNDRIIK